MATVYVRIYFLEVRRSSAPPHLSPHMVVAAPFCGAAQRSTPNHSKGELVICGFLYIFVVLKNAMSVSAR
jgi:hypothetical protein